MWMMVKVTTMRVAEMEVALVQRVPVAMCFHEPLAGGGWWMVEHTVFHDKLAMGRPGTRRQHKPRS
jgi:hypothetical protein